MGFIPRCDTHLALHRVLLLVGLVLLAGCAVEQPVHQEDASQTKRSFFDYEGKHATAGLAIDLLSSNASLGFSLHLEYSFNPNDLNSVHAYLFGANGSIAVLSGGLNYDDSHNLRGEGAVASVGLGATAFSSPSILAGEPVLTQFNQRFSLAEPNGWLVIFWSNQLTPVSLHLEAHDSTWIGQVHSAVVTAASLKNLEGGVHFVGAAGAVSLDDGLQGEAAPSVLTVLKTYISDTARGEASLTTSTSVHTFSLNGRPNPTSCAICFYTERHLVVDEGPHSLALTIAGAKHATEVFVHIVEFAQGPKLPGTTVSLDEEW